MTRRYAVMVVTETAIIHDLEQPPVARELRYQGDGLDIYVHVQPGVTRLPSRQSAIANAAMHVAFAFGVPPGTLRDVRKRPAKKVGKAEKAARARTKEMFDD